MAWRGDAKRPIHVILNFRQLQYPGTHTRTAVYIRTHTHVHRMYVGSGLYDVIVISVGSGEAATASCIVSKVLVLS